MPRQHPADPRLAEGRRLLGDRLRDLRQEAGLTLPQVEAQTRISMSHLSDCERGEKALSLPALFTLAEVHGLLVTDLLDGVYPYGSRRKPTDDTTRESEVDEDTIAKLGREPHRSKSRTRQRPGPPDRPRRQLD